MHVNITARVLGEQALRQSEAEQRRLARQLLVAQAVGNVGSWQTDLSTMEVSWSEQTHRIFETDPETFETTHASFLERVHPKDRDAVGRAFQDSLRDTGPFSVEHRVLLPDGRTKVVEERWQTFRDEHGQVTHAVGSCQDITERKQAETALGQAAARMEALSRQVLHAQEDERRRIARGLYDELGQALTALKINVQGAAQGGDDSAARHRDGIAIIDQAIQQVRGMALDLRPSILDDLGLIAALRWYVGRHAQRTGVQGRVDADPDHIRAHPEIETVCFRIAQEALTNVARHARATQLSVERVQHPEGLLLVVRDNGIGFDPESALRVAWRGNSLGLVGMRERVELVGGRIAFVSQPNAGSEVHVELPNSPRPPQASGKIGRSEGPACTHSGRSERPTAAVRHPTPRRGAGPGRAVRPTRPEAERCPSARSQNRGRLSGGGSSPAGR